LCWYTLAEKADVVIGTLLVAARVGIGNGHTITSQADGVSGTIAAVEATIDG